MKDLNYYKKLIFFKFWLRTPKRIISWLYAYVLKREMPWDNPQDLNEKIQWLKIYGDTSMWAKLADKYAVREYIKLKGLEHILVPLYAKWDKAEDIDLSALPKSFVLKTNHGSGEIMVVKDKNLLDINEVKAKFKVWLQERYGYLQGEPHYLSIKPIVIAEELLIEKHNTFSTSLVDYKVWCFNGKPYCVWACHSRSSECAYVGTYDLDWNYHPEWSVFTEHYRDGKGVVPKPASLDEMLVAAAKLSQGFPQVRVDFYDVDGKLYFGEMTFTSNGGWMQFFTRDFLLLMGNQVILNAK